MWAPREPDSFKCLSDGSLVFLGDERSPESRTEYHPQRHTETDADADGRSTLAAVPPVMFHE